MVIPSPGKIKRRWKTTIIEKFNQELPKLDVCIVIGFSFRDGFNQIMNNPLYNRKVISNSVKDKKWESISNKLDEIYEKAFNK